jgi:hypothetical protein
MSFDTNGPRGRPDDKLAPHTAEDALLRWDELDEQLLKVLADDPERGWRLKKLQDADGWLRDRAGDAARKAAPALLVCPPPEDLYDFGGGPGANSLSAERRSSIDRHLATCLECERFVRTLESVPPSPLIHGLPSATEIDELETPPARAPRRRGLRLVPLLASAAAVLVLFFGVRSLLTPARLSFPDAPLLRGSAGGPVLFPRERVLLPSAELAAAFPALAAPVRFEVEAQAGADHYLFELYRHEGKAIGRDVRIGDQVAAGNSAVAQTPKAEGRFKFSAWVVRNGRDQHLGEHDFQVVTDPALESSLRALSGDSTVERTLAAVHVLDAAGYLTDARELARTLPPSPERDRYLAQVPGR